MIQASSPFSLTLYKFYVFVSQGASSLIGVNTYEHLGNLTVSTAVVSLEDHRRNTLRYGNGRTYS